MQRINIAMLGCGGVAHLYLPVFKYLEEAQLVALVDIDKEKAKYLAERYGIEKVYSDVEEVASAPEIDAVIVGTPPNLHAEHVEVCAFSGKHILCEKPMASTVRDCQRIIDACRKNKVKLQMAHMKRFMRGNQMVKSILDSGCMGKIFMAECHWDCAVPQLIGTYRETEVTGGGNLQDHGPHAFDLIRWWTGNDILEVSASIRIVHPQRPTEDTAVVILEHENGMVSNCHMTRVSYGREHWQDLYRIYGTDATLVVRNDHHFPTTSLQSPEIILYKHRGCIQRYDLGHPWNQDDTVIQNNPFLNQLKAFCECIVNDTEPRVTGEDGMHVIEAVIAAYVSSLKGIKVKLPFREDVDLRELFKQVKDRDRRNLKYDYTIDNLPKPSVFLNAPIYAFRPPRTKEKWSDEKHGMIKDVEYDNLMASLRRK
ncbi:hypothetical protein DRQ15_06390 [candidate division KSB1 bacterium]|nr:MAG: hypothetical protein DRQ15_06390 [candidate division KSB1 bacterium]